MEVPRAGLEGAKWWIVKSYWCRATSGLRETELGLRGSVSSVGAGHRGAMMTSSRRAPAGQNLADGQAPAGHQRRSGSTRQSFFIEKWE